LIVKFLNIKTMSEVIKFEDKEIGAIYFEVEEGSQNFLKSEKGAMILAGSKDEEIGSFEAALDKIRRISTKVIDQIRNVDMRPDEIECKFGIKFNAETGVIFAKASTEGNLEITLTWKNNNNPKSTEPTA